MTTGPVNPELESVENSSTTLVKTLQTLRLTVLHRFVEFLWISQTRAKYTLQSPYLG